MIKTEVVDTNNPRFWRERPHVFVPARWGRKYCRVCNDPKRRVIHVPHRDFELIGNAMLTDYRLRDKEVIYAVEGWNDEGGSCSFAAKRTYEECLAFIESGLAVDSKGREYEHYQIDRRTYFEAVDTDVVVIR